jgi:hypothetical protein
VAKKVQDAICGQLLTRKPGAALCHGTSAQEEQALLVPEPFAFDLCEQDVHRQLPRIALSRIVVAIAMAENKAGPEGLGVQAGAKEDVPP